MADLIESDSVTSEGTDTEVAQADGGSQSSKPAIQHEPDRESTRSVRVANTWNRIRYGLYAPIYGLVARPMAAGRNRAIERLELEAGDRVLILGSGPGVDLEYLPPDVEVTAVDLTPGMIRRTEARAEELGREVDARVGDAQSLPFADESFDAVLLHLILTVVPDPNAVVAETERVLAPDGRVSIFDKFVPEDESPSLVRRAMNPLAKLLFSELTRSLEPMLAETDLRTGPRESFLFGLYTVTIARPDASTREQPIEG